MKGEFKWDFERLKWDFCWIAGSGEDYEIDLSAVDLKPEIYAQTVYSIS